MHNQQIKALKFWHDRAGQFLGGAAWDKSLSCAYPCNTVSGNIKLTRMGSLAPAAILIDENEAIVIERLAVEKLPDSAASVRIINHFDSSQYSLARTVCEWAINPDRGYPFLALMPTKKGIVPFLSLSETPCMVFVVEPGNVRAFNPDEMRQCRDAVMTLPNPDKWRWAAHVRQETDLASGQLHLDNFQRQRLDDNYQKAREEVPLEIVLPKPFTVEFDVLVSLMQQKPGLPL